MPWGSGAAVVHSLCHLGVEVEGFAVKGVRKGAARQTPHESVGRARIPGLRLRGVQERARLPPHHQQCLIPRAACTAMGGGGGGGTEENKCEVNKRRRIRGKRAKRERERWNIIIRRSKEEEKKKKKKKRHRVPEEASGREGV